MRLQAVRNSAITFRAESGDDTGIRFDHPDLAGRTVTGTLPGQRGYDFVTSVTGGNGLPSSLNERI
jgi:hypothetical protein